MEVCIYRPGALGDLLVTLPILQWLLEAKGARITLIASPDWEPVAKGMAHRFVSCEDRTLLPLFSGHPLDLASSPQWICEGGFQFAFLLLRNQDQALEDAFRWISSEVFWIQSRPDALGRGWTYGIDVTSPGEATETVQPGIAGRVNIRDYLFRQLRPLGAIADRPAASWPVISQSPEDSSFVRKSALPALLIHAGSGSEEKNWPIESYWRLASSCVSAGISVFWTIGPADQSRDYLHKNGAVSLREATQAGNGPSKEDSLSAKIQRLESDMVPQHYTVELPLGELITFLGLFEIMIGNDSGILHLASAMGLRVIALFGKSDPILWAPEGPGGQAIALGSELGFPGEDEVQEALSFIMRKGFR